MLLYTFLAACFRISKVSIWLFAGFQTVKYIFTHSNTSSQRSSFVFVSQMNVSYENAGWSRPWWWKVSDQGGFNKFSLPQLSPEARLLDVLNPSVFACVCHVKAASWCRCVWPLDWNRRSQLTQISLSGPGSVWTSSSRPQRCSNFFYSDRSTWWERVEGFSLLVFAALFLHTVQI